MKLKVLLCFLLSVSAFSSYAADPSNVTRATLSNGLQVVIVRNALAPVVTVELNFKVGGDETPAGFPGMAHAEEHMAFRGCAGMTADQTAAIYAHLGGQDNADTQQNITQYFTTVPAADLDVALAGPGRLPARGRRLGSGVGARTGRDRAGGCRATSPIRPTSLSIG